MIFVSLIPYWNFEHPGFEKEKKKKQSLAVFHRQKMVNQILNKSAK